MEDITEGPGSDEVTVVTEVTTGRGSRGCMLQSRQNIVTNIGADLNLILGNVEAAMLGTQIPPKLPGPFPIPLAVMSQAEELLGC